VKDWPPSPRWQVRLRGTGEDLARLGSLLHGDVAVRADEHGDFYLLARAFEAYSRADEVREAAEELVAQIRGAVRLHLAVPTSVGLAGVIERVEGSQRAVTVSVEAMTLISSIMPTTWGYDSEPESSMAESLHRAGTDGDIAKALRLYGQPQSWTSLYSVVEVISASTGLKGPQAAGWVSRRQLERFMRTANSHAAAGDTARHAGKSFEPPANPMTLAEAGDFVGELLREWMRQEP
jgi:hypothetical protein